MEAGAGISRGRGVGRCLLLPEQSCADRALTAGRDGRVMGANLLRVLVDLVFLTLIVLARKALPFSYEMALAGAAAAIGMMGIYFAFRTAGADAKNDKDEKDGGSD